MASFENIVRFTDLRADKLRVLLHALCATELVDRKGDLYVNSAVAEELLAPEGADSWQNILVGWQRIYYPAFVHLTSALRHESNTALSAHPGSEPTLYERLEHNPELQATFHAAMSAFTLRSMSGLVENAELASIERILDVGGNDGTTATQLAARYPDMQITIFDLPSVAKAGQRAAATEYASRITFHPGDLFEDAFPGNVDAILFSHVLEVFCEEQILFLLAKAYDVLPIGGKVLIYGFNVTDDERRGLFSARLSLYLNVLASGQGMAYPARDWERWLRQVGYSQARTFTELPYEHGLTVGSKE